MVRATAREMAARREAIWSFDLCRINGSLPLGGCGVRWGDFSVGEVGRAVMWLTFGGWRSIRSGFVLSSPGARKKSQEWGTERSCLIRESKCRSFASTPRSPKARDRRHPHLWLETGATRSMTAPTTPMSRVSRRVPSLRFGVGLLIYLFKPRSASDRP